MNLDCDDLRMQATDLHRMAEERMLKAVEGRRFGITYTAQVQLVADIEVAAEKVEAEIVDRCD